MRKLCRTCLKEITSMDFININDSTSNTSSSHIVKQELAICMPELDLNLVVNAVVCTTCVKDLHVAYDFKRRCLLAEDKIKAYVQSNSLDRTCVDLNYLMGYCNKSKYPIRDQVTAIDVEQISNTDQSELDVELGNSGNKIPDFCFTSEPTCTNYSYSNGASLNGEKRHEQVSHLNFPQQGKLLLLSEFPKEGLHEKSETVSLNTGKTAINETSFKNQMRQMWHRRVIKPKSSTERVRAHRERMRAQRPPKKPPKSAAQRGREFRARLKASKSSIKVLTSLAAETPMIDKLESTDEKIIKNDILLSDDFTITN